MTSAAPSAIYRKIKRRKDGISLSLSSFLPLQNDMASPPRRVFIAIAENPKNESIFLSLFKERDIKRLQRMEEQEEEVKEEQEEEEKVGEEREEARGRAGGGGGRGRGRAGGEAGRGGGQGRGGDQV